MGLIKSAVADGVLTLMWVFCSSTFGILTSLVAAATGVQGLKYTSLFITTVLVFLFVLVFNVIGAAMGGASFNPTGTASFYAAGLTHDSLTSLSVRFPAQAAGAVFGVLAVKEFLPAKYQHMVRGPYLKVELHTGAIAEGVLTFVISFIVLFIILRELFHWLSTSSIRWICKEANSAAVEIGSNQHSIGIEIFSKESDCSNWVQFLLCEDRKGYFRCRKFCNAASTKDLQLLIFHESNRIRHDAPDRFIGSSRFDPNWFGLI
uniref:Uncharacterized protein n=1 Tax=Kalanchoe fedtschenkoi TaxID=63787 RepID=A0A7N0UXC3_KALFE